MDKSVRKINAGNSDILQRFLGTFGKTYGKVGFTRARRSYAESYRVFLYSVYVGFLTDGLALYLLAADKFNYAGNGRDRPRRRRLGRYFGRRARGKYPQACARKLKCRPF